MQSVSSVVAKQSSWKKILSSYFVLLIFELTATTKTTFIQSSTAEIQNVLSWGSGVTPKHQDIFQLSWIISCSRRQIRNRFCFVADPTWKWMVCITGVLFNYRMFAFIS